MKKYTMNGTLFIILCFLISGCIRENLDGCPAPEPPVPPPTGPFLELSESAIQVYDGAITRIFITSNQPDVIVNEEGFLDATGGTTFAVNSFFDSLAGERAANLTYDPETGTGYLDIGSLSNQIGTYVHRIIVTAGELQQEVTVTTNITLLPDWTIYRYRYVGTFHRWNQTGERVISSAYSGPWRAEVLTDEGDFVVLNRMPSPATIAGILRTSSPGDAESYQVPGNETAVSGNGRVFFRVGLKGHASSATSHRYTRIRVNWQVNGVDSVSYIYVRQGEAADYVMRPIDDLTGSPTIPARLYAAKFVPFNITDPNLGGGPNITDHSPINGGEGIFTDYPSQAGYLFLWNLSDSTNYRRAFNPSIPAPGVSIVGFTKEILSFAWNPAKDVCPPGYRHATDGEWNTVNSPYTSEFRQSLFEEVITGFGGTHVGNSLFGYYADGWSDRQEFGVSPRASVPLGTIGTGGRIAYIGRLFFNPNTNASLFFPAGGGRSANTGQLTGDGTNGIYWSTSTGGGGAAAFLSVFGRMNNQRTGSADYARCVQQ